MVSLLLVGPMAVGVMIGPTGVPTATRLHGDVLLNLWQAALVGPMTPVVAVVALVALAAWQKWQSRRV